MGHEFSRRGFLKLGGVVAAGTSILEPKLIKLRETEE
jgi:hypothetical protein